jgi:hypothetical protein
MTLPVSRTILSANHSSGWDYRRDGTSQTSLRLSQRERPNKLFIHSTRSTIAGRSHDLEMQSTINWFLSANSKASSHLVISPTEIVRMVEDEHPAWHAKEHSWQAWAIEVTQPTLDTPYEEGHHRLLARAVRHYMGLGVPLVHLPSLKWGDVEGGIIGHDASAQGIRDGKSDPGPRFGWGKLFAYVNELLVPGNEEESVKYIRIKGQREVYAVVGGQLSHAASGMVLAGQVNGNWTDFVEDIDLDDPDDRKRKINRAMVALPVQYSGGIPAKLGGLSDT